MTIIVSANQHHCYGTLGKAIFLHDGERLVGGWIDNAFEYAAEALKAALPNVEVRFDPTCEAESRALWDAIKVFDDSRLSAGD